MTLATDFNMGAAGDDLYAALLDAHKGLSEADSHRLNARLVLILMNHVADADTIRAAIALARHTAPTTTGADDRQLTDRQLTTDR